MKRFVGMNLGQTDTNDYVNFICLGIILSKIQFLCTHPLPCFIPCALIKILSVK